jgi:hypothetical protein
VGFIGDSKTANLYGGVNPWVANLVAQLNVADERGLYVEEDAPQDWAQGGAGVAQVRALVGSLATHTVKSYVDENVFLINIGSCDFPISTSEADFKTNYLAIIDALVTKYTSPKCYLSKPWRRTYDAEATAMAGWIDDIIAARPGVAFVGDNENVWMKGGDDGATMTTDGIHNNNVAGQAEKVRQARIILGY